MNRIIATFLVYFLFSTITIAQNIVIEGVIKDSKQKEALPYANIFLQESYYGTISNQNGQFKIIIPKEKRSDSLVVSYIGYKTQTFCVSKIKNSFLPIY